MSFTVGSLKAPRHHVAYKVVRSDRLSPYAGKYVSGQARRYRDDTTVVAKKPKLKPRVGGCAGDSGIYVFLTLARAKRCADFGYRRKVLKVRVNSKDFVARGSAIENTDLCATYTKIHVIGEVEK